MKFFEKVDTSTMHDHDIDPTRIVSFLMVYSTVRCYNKAGLPAQTTSDGVKLVGDGLSHPVVENSFIVLPAGSNCHLSMDTVQLRWENMDAWVDIKSIKVTGFRYFCVY